MPVNRGAGITMIGALSEQRGVIHVDIFQGSNNTDLFMAFLVRLKQKCAGRRVAVVLDNLKIHESRKLEAVYDETFVEMRLPPYSSTLNPIERLWSLVKRKWSRELHRFTEDAYDQQQGDHMTSMMIGRLHGIIGK